MASVCAARVPGSSLVRLVSLSAVTSTSGGGGGFFLAREDFEGRSNESFPLEVVVGFFLIVITIIAVVLLIIGYR